MKKRCFLALLFSAAVVLAIEPRRLAATTQFDPYGGLVAVSCPNTTGHFILTKVNNRWSFCTPAGHVFVAMNVGNTEFVSNPTLDCNGNNVYTTQLAKYGGSSAYEYNWTVETLNRLKTADFNAIGQDSVGWLHPGYGAIGEGKQRLPSNLNMPYIVEISAATYAMSNDTNTLASPVKDMVKGLGPVYTAYRQNALPDVFDPGIGQQAAQEMATSPGITSKSPYLLGVLADDTDYFAGVGAGPAFPTTPAGMNNTNLGYVVLITAPVQTFVESTMYGSKSFLYSNTAVLTKTNARNPTTTCSASNPCSLRDYLWQKYSGNIAALNEAWGSNYTTFGSTAVQQSTVVGTGNGQSTTFSGTLNNPIEPESVQVLTGSTVVAGDCPWFISSCGSKMAASTGYIDSPTKGAITASSINYQTGAFSVTFATPPASGAAVTVNYLTGGWMSGGTGLVDESGSSPWAGTNPWCLEGADPQFPTYFVCTGAFGALPAPNANPQLGADLDAWISQALAAYTSQVSTAVHAATGTPYFGLDDVGSWGAPAFAPVYEGMSPYVDGFFDASFRYDFPSQAAYASIYQYVTTYNGDKPFMTFGAIDIAQATSSEWCHTTNIYSYPSQATRGQAWQSNVQYLLTTASANDDFPLVGFDWWSWQDFQGINQGLVTLHDNLYDGIEDVTGTGTDQWGYPTGGETADYGDAMTAVTSGNAFWYSLSW